MKKSKLIVKLRKSIRNLLRTLTVIGIVTTSGISLSVYQENLAKKELLPIIDSLTIENIILNNRMIGIYNYLDAAAEDSTYEIYEGDTLYQRIMAFDKIHNDNELKIPRVLPLEYNNILYISSWFGPRIHPIYKVRANHEGIDYVAKPWTPVYSTAPGVVVKTRRRRYGYGWFIIIDHQNGYKSLYAHLSSINVHEGDTVNVGHFIGRVGSTGLSSGPHLHYEVRYNNYPINPANIQDFSIINKGYKKLVDMAVENDPG